MIRRGLAAMVVASALAAPAGAAPCGGVSVETFEVRTEWGKKVYPPGATVTVDVTVLRPARKDPFGFGIPLEPPHQAPVDDAEVITSLSVGVPPVWGGGYTDENGELHLEIELRPDIRGPVQATTRASIVYNEEGPDCTQVEEWGRKVDDPAFVVKG